jgi:hypothetical protein
MSALKIGAGRLRTPPRRRLGALRQHSAQLLETSAFHPLQTFNGPAAQTGGRRGQGSGRAFEAELTGGDCTLEFALELSTEALSLKMAFLSAGSGVS